MDLQILSEKQKSAYDKLVTHIIQSWQWGEFRKSMGIPVLRYGLYKDGKLSQAFQLTLHKIPFTNQFVGYLPKGPFPNQDMVDALKKIGRENNCAYIKIEPDIETGSKQGQASKDFKKASKPLFTKHNMVVDLTQSEEALLKNMSPKTRYNIKVAQKHHVVVEERDDDQALEIYLKLYFETTKRQRYFGHNQNYHRKVWATLKNAHMARLLIAFYTPPESKTPIPLTGWMLVKFKDTLYYPYGGSSKEYKNVMANNLVAWEAIKLGKRLKLKKFDMWGTLGENPDPKNPWIGFHNFKKGLGGKPIEFIGAYDLVLNWSLYLLFNKIDQSIKLKVFLLKLLGE